MRRRAGILSHERTVDDFTQYSGAAPSSTAGVGVRVRTAEDAWGSSSELLVACRLVSVARS